MTLRYEPFGSTQGCRFDVAQDRPFDAAQGRRVLPGSRVATFVAY